jgi:hypothetical protein
MLDGNTESDRPTIEESYGLAASTSDLTVEDPSRGPARLLIASGKAMYQTLEQKIAALGLPPDKPSITFGHTLARLQSEWHGEGHPIRRKPKSVRRWLDILPMVKIGEREVVEKGEKKTINIMSRDKPGAREAHLNELHELDALYAQELKFLAQRLPSRQAVRERLYAVAVHWGWEDAENRVAEVIRHWLDDNCATCHGTGKVIVGIDNTITCPDCHGAMKVGVPHGGHGLNTFMGDCLNEWRKSVASMARKMRT